MKTALYRVLYSLLMLAIPLAQNAYSASAPLTSELSQLVEAGFLPNYRLVVVSGEGAQAAYAEHYEQGIVAVESLKADSVVSLLSLSKPITNLLALKLIDEGHLSLDDPLSKFLPQFNSPQVHNADGTARSATNNIVIRDLLLHTAGFGQNADLLGWGSIANLYADKRIFGLNCLSGSKLESLADVTDRAASLPLASEPGEKFAYSIATDVLGRVLEIATGESFASLMRKHVVTPLALTDLTFEVPAKKANRIAQLYQPLIKTYPVPGNYQRYEPFNGFETDAENAGMTPGCISPGTGIMASMKDMVRLAEFFLRDLKLENGEPFLSNKLASQIFQHGLAPTLGDKPLRKSFAYAGNDGLSIASLAIRPKKGGDLATVSDHDFYYWSGFSGSGLWVDKSTGTAGVLLTQFYPSDRFLIPKLVAKVRATLN